MAITDDLAEFVPPYSKALGMRVERTEEGRVELCLPYAEHLVGDPDTGTVHGGVITAFLDYACGMATRYDPRMPPMTSMATLDLRIEYMRPAEPGKDIYATAEAHKFTRNIAFIRALAHQGDRDDPIASSSATFMLGTPNQPRS